jgi:hypothetical protein
VTVPATHATRPEFIFEKLGRCAPHLERPNDACRTAGDENRGRNVVEYHRTRCDNSAVPNPHARTDNRTARNPRMILDDDRGGTMDAWYDIRDELSSLELRVGGDVDVRTDPKIVSKIEIDALVQRGIPSDVKPARVTDDRDATEYSDGRMDARALRSP